MLYFNLTPVFRARGITQPMPFLMKIGISRRCAGKLIHDYTYRPDLRHITAICIALHCTPNDILAFNPAGEPPTAEDHPIRALIPHPSGPDLADRLKSLPLSKVAEIEALLAASTGNS